MFVMQWTNLLEVAVIVIPLFCKQSTVTLHIRISFLDEERLPLCFLSLQFGKNIITVIVIKIGKKTCILTGIRLMAGSL